MTDWDDPEVRDGVPYIPRDVAMEAAEVEMRRWRDLLDRLA